MFAGDRDTRYLPKSTTLPPLMACTTLHWDGKSAVYRDAGLQHDVECIVRSSLQVQWRPATARQAPPPATSSPQCLLPAPPPRPIDCDSEAACLTFYLDPGLLLPTACPMLVRATGTLLWVRRQGHQAGGTASVHPMLFVYAAAESLQAERVELVPHLAIHDPLLHHIVLLLQVASTADGVVDRLYAELLANALAVHLLQRCVACEQSRQGGAGGLPLPKLRRTIAHIQAHLEHELSVATLAAVVQMSPAHFARLFKQATGQTPHQYVLRCRIERAKQLLVETDLSLSEIGAQIGCTDQSHFTALFRRYVTTTPRAYRSDTQR